MIWKPANMPTRHWWKERQERGGGWMNESQRVGRQCFSRHAQMGLNMFRLIHFSVRTSQQLNLWRNVWSCCLCSLSTFPPRTDTQDVTFYSIEEVTLHHKDVARQHPRCSHFLFSVYDNTAVSDFSQKKWWRGKILSTFGWKLVASLPRRH